MRSYTLCQLESALAPGCPQTLFPKAAGKPTAATAHYTRWRTFWCMLWQGFNPKASGREVVRQLQALFRLEDGPSISHDDGAYCRAKARLPLSEFPKAPGRHRPSRRPAGPGPDPLQGRPLKAVDGSALTLPDTPKNRRAYPPLQCADRPSFPMMRIVVLFSLLSGAISSTGPRAVWPSPNCALFASLLSHLAARGHPAGGPGLWLLPGPRPAPAHPGAWISLDEPPAASMAGGGSNAWPQRLVDPLGKAVPAPRPG